MTEPIGWQIKAAREARNWSREQLAVEAQKIPGAPDISKEQVMEIEKGRSTVKLHSNKEPLPYILRALGLGADVLLAAVNGMQR